MPIQQLEVTNFKGIAGPQIFDLRPLTIFVGANSSGKSSCIHALAVLSQTLKLGNTGPAIVLDDDFAQVHLGRFSEISHSRGYSGSIDLGLNVGEVSVPGLESGDSAGNDISGKIITGGLRAHYSFKSTLRTQEVYISSASISVGGQAVSIKRAAKPPYAFSLQDNFTKQRIPVDRKNFLFRPSDPVTENADLPGWFRTFMFTERAQKHIEAALRNTFYLGPFRQSPLRRYPFRGTSASEVGALGEATITMLASEYIQAQDRPHVKQVNRWLSELGLAKSVTLARVGTSDLFEAKLTLPDGNKLPIADLGYGLSQVLPVLTQCSFSPPEATLLFEQPELHLHESAAKKLANIFHETATTKKSNIVIETHSRELIYEFLQLVKAGEISPDGIAIYSVRREGGASQYTRVRIELQDGALEVSDPWFKTLTGS